MDSGFAAIGFLKTLLPKSENDSVQGSLFQRELPNGVRDSVGSAAGRPTLCPRFGKAAAFPKLQPHGESDSLHSQSPTAPYECSSLRTGRASEAAPDPQPSAPFIRVARSPTTNPNSSTN